MSEKRVATFHSYYAVEPDDCLKLLWDGQLLATHDGVDFYGKWLSTECYVEIDERSGGECGPYKYQFVCWNDDTGSIVKFYGDDPMKDPDYDG